MDSMIEKEIAMAPRKAIKKILLFPWEFLIVVDMNNFPPTGSTS
jgi:hypothetical protein